MKRVEICWGAQTREKISAVSGPKFTILWGHVEEILPFKKFFSFVDTCLSCEDIDTKFCDAAQMAIFLCPVFSASCMQHISDMHPKFILRPHYVWKYGRHPICDG